MKIFSKLGKFYIGDPSAMSLKNFNIWKNKYEAESGNFTFECSKDSTSYMASFINVENGNGIYPSCIISNYQDNDEIKNLEINNNTISLIPIELINKKDIDYIIDSCLIVEASEAELKFDENENLEKIEIDLYNRDNENVDFAINLFKKVEIYTNSMLTDDDISDLSDNENYGLEYYDLEESEN